MTLSWHDSKPQSVLGWFYTPEATIECQEPLVRRNGDSRAEVAQKLCTDGLLSPAPHWSKSKLDHPLRSEAAGGHSGSGRQLGILNPQWHDKRRKAVRGIKCTNTTWNWTNTWDPSVPFPLFLEASICPSILDKYKVKSYLSNLNSWHPPN